MKVLNILSKEQIELSIYKNREEINRFLYLDIPLDILYFNVKRLTASNQRLLKMLK